MYTEDMLMTTADLRVMAAKVAAINARRRPLKKKAARGWKPKGDAQAIKLIRHSLRQRGDSIPKFAERHGYAVRTVYQAVETWAGRTDRDPLGGISRSIMADLRAELGPDVVPDHTTSRQAA